MSALDKSGKRYRTILNRVPRRTNECWLGNVQDEDGVYVCGHKFLLRIEGNALALWRSIDSRHTVVDLAREMGEAYPTTSPSRILEDVVEFLVRLESLGLAAWRTRPLFEDVQLDD